MTVECKHRHSRLFTVRLWLESQSGGEIRGQAQSVLTGEVIYFRTWADLVTFFETMLVAARPPPAAESTDDDTSQVCQTKRSGGTQHYNG
ncbi:MAG: hypothetical protein DYG89_50910 [Caldilinea sp. CFX5]|nr:hypothetical protein [Caldilinea sp. CFX5]